MGKVDITTIGLDGKTLEQRQQDERDNWQRKFFVDELARLDEIRTNIDYYDGLSKETSPDGDWFELKKLMGSWWYCNHIEGWDNKVPHKDTSKEFSPCTYDSIPASDLMSDCIRDCFISVDRDGVKWDKEYALRRLNKAIEEYQKEVDKCPKNDSYEEDCQPEREDFLVRDHDEDKDEDENYNPDIPYYSESKKQLNLGEWFK